MDYEKLIEKIKYEDSLLRNILISPLGTSPERDQEVKKIFKGEYGKFK